jgi:hypothetical protein
MTRKPYSEEKCPGTGQVDPNAGEFHLSCPVCRRRFERGRRKTSTVPAHTDPRAKP